MPWKVIEEKTENGRIFMLSELVDYSKEEKEEMLKFKMKCEKEREEEKQRQLNSMYNSVWGCKNIDCYKFMKKSRIFLDSILSNIRRM